MPKNLQKNSFRVLFIVLCLCLPPLLWSTVQLLFRGSQLLDRYFTIDLGNELIVQFDQCEYFFYILCPILFFLFCYLFIVKQNIFLQKNSGISTQNRVIATVLGAFILWYLISSFFTTICYCIMPLFLPAGPKGYVLGPAWIAYIGYYDPIMRAFSFLQSAAFTTGKQLLGSEAYSAFRGTASAWCTYYLPSYTFMALCIIFYRKAGKGLRLPMKSRS